jgi:hypothetical protein
MSVATLTERAAATDVREGGTSLGDRIIVSGGGGGTGEFGGTRGKGGGKTGGAGGCFLAYAGSRCEKFGGYGGDEYTVGESGETFLGDGSGHAVLLGTDPHGIGPDGNNTSMD